MNVSPYESLVSLASQLDAFEDTDDIGSDNFSAVKAIIDRNERSLEQAAVVLKLGCVVPVRYEEAFISDHLDDFSHLRRLARLWYLECDYATHQGDYRRVSRCGLRLIELANTCRRGGLVLDAQLAMIVSGMGLQKLRAVRKHFDGTHRKELIAELERLHGEREPFNEIAKRDDTWETMVKHEESPEEIPLDADELGMTPAELDGVLEAMRHLANCDDDRRSLQRQQDNRNLAFARLLVTDLALREYRQTYGIYPRVLEGLSPQFLSQVPTDPFSGAVFRYRRFKSSFRLSSTGVDAPQVPTAFGTWWQCLMRQPEITLDD